MATASAGPGAGAGGLPRKPPRRTRGSPGNRLRLRSGIGGRLRPVPERPLGGAGPGRPRRGARARSRGREGATHPRPHPWRACSRLGLRWFQDAPDTERLFAVRWDGDAYRLVVPPQAGTETSLAYRPPAGVVAEFHSHGALLRLLLGHRRPGRAGLPHLRRRRTPRHSSAGAASAGRGLRPLRPGGLVRRCSDGPDPGLLLVRQRRAGSSHETTIETKRR